MITEEIAPSRICVGQRLANRARWQPQTLKNRVLLNYFLQRQLEAAVAGFVHHYNHRRYDESLDNLTPADVYFGRGQAILEIGSPGQDCTLRLASTCCAASPRRRLFSVRSLPAPRAPAAFPPRKWRAQRQLIAAL